jgi:hypothetical protein
MALLVGQEGKLDLLIFDRYNLLNSAILEMFEFIKIEDIKSLCTHVAGHLAGQDHLC